MKTKAAAVVSETRICPSCKQGNHAKHSYDYYAVKTGVTLCRCPECKPKNK